MKPALFIFLLMVCGIASASNVASGTPDAAVALAKQTMASQFIQVESPKVDGDTAVVTAKLMGQECQLNMARTKQESGGYGWQIYGQVCGTVPGAQKGKWITDEQGVPRFVLP